MIEFINHIKTHIMKKLLLIVCLGFIATNLIAQDGSKAEKKELKKDKKEYKMEKKADKGKDEKAEKKREDAQRKEYKKDKKEAKGK